MIKSISLLSIFLITTLVSFSQITNSNVEPDKEKKDVKEESKDSTVYSRYYLTGSFIHSYRYFEDLSVYQNLGERLNEEPINTFGLGFGTYIPLGDNLDLEIGVSYVLQGEQYTFSDSLTDSTFHYVNKYRHFGLPLRLNYSIGKGNFKGLVVAGVIPSSILSIKYESDYTTIEGSEVVNEVEKKTNDIASFNLVASVGLGVTYQKGDVAFVLMPEYRHNLLNTFSTYKFNHNLWSWGVNTGIIMNF